MGAKLLGMYPIVPLLPSGGLGVALFSYEGKLCWGFNADYELVPNLSEFVDDIGWSFEQLRAAVVTGFLDRRTATTPIEEPPPNGDAGRTAEASQMAPHDLRLVDADSEDTPAAVG
jgi:hypothetical protein